MFLSRETFEFNAQFFYVFRRYTPTRTTDNISYTLDQLHTAKTQPTLGFDDISQWLKTHMI